MVLGISLQSIQYIEEIVVFKVLRGADWDGSHLAHDVQSANIPSWSNGVLVVSISNFPICSQYAEMSFSLQLYPCAFKGMVL